MFESSKETSLMNIMWINSIDHHQNGIGLYLKLFDVVYAFQLYISVVYKQNGSIVSCTTAKIHM